MHGCEVALPMAEASWGSWGVGATSYRWKDFLGDKSLTKSQKKNKTWGRRVIYIVIFQLIMFQKF